MQGPGPDLLPNVRLCLGLCTLHPRTSDLLSVPQSLFTPNGPFPKIPLPVPPGFLSFIVQLSAQRPCLGEPTHPLGLVAPVLGTVPGFLHIIALATSYCNAGTMRC